MIHLKLYLAANSVLGVQRRSIAGVRNPSVQTSKSRALSTSADAFQSDRLQSLRLAGNDEAEPLGPSKQGFNKQSPADFMACFESTLR
jgi:hypothetical protein